MTYSLELVGLVLAAAAVLYQLHRRRVLAARRATLEFISKFEVHSSEWSECCAAFKRWKDQDTPFGPVISPNSDSDRRDAVRVLELLNHFELVAVGIEHKIIDSRLYKEWFRDTYVQYWRVARPLVEKLRSERKSSRLFIRFEQLAYDWELEIDAGEPDS